MLEPLVRLKRRADFLRMTAKGRKCHMPAFVLVALRRDKEAVPSPAAAASCTRAGLTVSRRVGGAVARNRARRRLRALLRGLARALDGRGYDLVLIARRDAVRRSFADMGMELNAALRRLRVFEEARAPCSGRGER